VNAKVLVVEDEAPIRDFVRINLERQGFAVLEAGSGEEGLALLEREHPDVLVLDVRLPGIDGFDVCRQVRQRNLSVPVLMLTARSEDLDKILGLELGADDYMTKPFNPRELVARIRAILRRTGDGAPPPPPAAPPAAAGNGGGVLQVGDLRVDVPRREVYVRGEAVTLTPREFDILTLLAGQPGVVFTRDQLLNHLWGENYFGDPKTVDVHVRRLREKIELDPARPIILLTVWGVGYKVSEGRHD